eukprot:3379804-Amphidinium_carterae.1
MEIAATEKRRIRRENYFPSRKGRRCKAGLCLVCSGLHQVIFASEPQKQPPLGSQVQGVRVFNQFQAKIDRFQNREVFGFKVEAKPIDAKTGNCGVPLIDTGWIGKIVFCGI